jgi:dynein heavy chain
VEHWMLELETMMKISIKDVMGQAIMDYGSTPRPTWMQRYLSMWIHIHINVYTYRNRHVYVSVGVHTHKCICFIYEYHFYIHVFRWAGMCVLNGSQMHWTQEMEELFLTEGVKGPVLMYERQLAQLADMTVFICVCIFVDIFIIDALNIYT